MTSIVQTGAHRAEASASLRLFRFLVAGYIFFIPVQISGRNVNFAPSDAMLVLAILAGLGRLRLAAPAWSTAHVGMLGIFFVSGFLSVSGRGELYSYVLLKAGGLVILFAFYIMITSAATDWDQIRMLLRTLILTVSAHCVFAMGMFLAGQYHPWLNYSNERVSGFLIDPNAFGGLVTLTLVIHGATLLSERPVVGGRTGILALSRSRWHCCSRFPALRGWASVSHAWSP
jgi:hypothetical protein